MDFHPFVPADIEAALGGRYVVDSEIAVGGQGAVFKATRAARPDGTATNDLVALKLHLYYNQDIRVQREITAMENISHVSLARPIEHGFCDVAGRHTRYVAWEFVEGQTLSERLKSGPLLESEVVAIGRDVSAAIAAIWSRRIVHGDIKPSNIMVRDSGEQEGTSAPGHDMHAVLIDLGAARHLEEDNSPAARKPFGTRGYFSPEQALGDKNLTCASDVFSLGVVLLQSLLGGRHPTDYHQSGLAHGIRASGGRLAVSTGLLSTLDKMMSEDPRFRPSPAELSGSFLRLQQKMEAEFAMGARPPRRHQR